MPNCKVKKQPIANMISRLSGSNHPSQPLTALAQYAATAQQLGGESKSGVVRRRAYQPRSRPRRGGGRLGLTGAGCCCCCGRRRGRRPKSSSGGTGSREPRYTAAPAWGGDGGARRWGAGVAAALEWTWMELLLLYFYFFCFFSVLFFRVLGLDSRGALKKA